MASDHLSEPIWDGNGGTLDPRKATQRDLLVALHVKMDQVVIPRLESLETNVESQRDGDLTRAQKAAVLELVQDAQDASVSRKQLKTPTWALVISCLALISSVVYTVAAVNGGVL